MSQPLVAKNAYVLLRADWTVDKALKLLENLRPSHAIVRNRYLEHTDLYYLFSTSAAYPLLRSSVRDTDLQHALDLHEDKATPIFDVSVLENASSDQGIVFDEGVVIGFFDQMVRKGGIRRGLTRGVTDANREPSTFYLSSDFPQQVQLDSTVSLLLSISSKDVGSRALPVALPNNAKVDIVIQPKQGFVLEGVGEGSLIAERGTESLPIQFKLKGIELGMGRIRIFAFYNGQPLGSIDIQATVVQKGVFLPIQRKTFGKDIAPIHVKSSEPDLSLLIFEQHMNGNPTLIFRLSSKDPHLGLNFKQFGPVPLTMNPLGYFSEFFTGIEELPLNTRQERLIAEQRLAAKGTHLFSTVIPQDLQVLLWELRDRIGSILIQSEEPWIPWEMCKLKGSKNGRVVEGPFLCEGFSVTRWIPQVGFKPKLTAKNIGLVVPSDSGLPFAADEKSYLLSLETKDHHVKIVPAEFTKLTKELAKGKFDAWHFTGHGGFRDTDPNLSGILLEKKEKLTPEDLSGVVENLGLSNPLVFLNACQVGRGAMSLTDIGGMAAKFLRVGAAAFIGAYWSVYDQAAFDFAKEFYTRLFAGVPIGNAAHQARLAIRPLGDPTWLAYTVYADPFAAIM